MSLLQISKKATTQAESKDLLIRSLAHNEAYGTPIHIIHPEEFSERHQEALHGNWFLNTFKRRAMHKELHNTFKKMVTEHSPNADIAEEILGNKEIMDTSSIVDLMKENRRYNAMNKSLVRPGFDRHAYNYSPDEYVPPVASIIVAPKMGMDNTSIMHSGLPSSRKENPPAPGLDGQWQFFTMEHERAHAAGAGEAQADMIAGIVTRKAFEDHSVIRAYADKSAIASILGFEDIEGNGKYGWATVEANDHVAGLPENTINELDEEQIKNIRFQKFMPLTKTLSKLGHIFRHEAGDMTIAFGDYDSMKETAKKLSQDNRLNEDEQHIFRRFALACQRFSIGKDAYGNKANDLLDEALLASENKRQLTFDKNDEFIPE